MAGSVMTGSVMTGPGMPGSVMGRGQRSVTGRSLGRSLLPPVRLRGRRRAGFSRGRTLGSPLPGRYAAPDEPVCVVCVCVCVRVCVRARARVRVCARARVWRAPVRDGPAVVPRRGEAKIVGDAAAGSRSVWKGCRRAKCRRPARALGRVGARPPSVQAGPLRGDACGGLAVT
jgi:hypothetical protein